MPAQRPRAAFEPISPDLDVADLVDSTPNFEYVARIHCDAIDANGLENFEKLVWLHVVLGGKPLVIEGFNQRLDNSIFSEKWLRSHYSMKTEFARDLTTKTDLPLTIGHYLKNMHLLTNQWTTHNYKDPNRQRIYLKDIDCPQQWHDHLKQLIPPPLFYLNKLPEMFEGPGAKTLSSNDDLLARSASGRPIAKAGDLMSCLPPFMRAENLMCYIGHEGTYTPAHQEMCASLGQNIMVEASDGSVEYGKATKPGSSIWFMTESKDRHVVAEYWMSTLGHDIDIEDHFAQINAWKAAPFKTMVCRDEQYKNKAIVFYALDHYSDLLSEVGDSGVWGLRVQLLLEDFELLFELYTQILLSESFLHDPPKDDIEYVPFDSNITCSYCRGNIFNRFLTCPWCIGEGDDTYDICMECYTMGRSCACISKLQWVEQFRWSELTGKYEKWRQQLLRFVEAKSDKYPCLPAKRAQLGRKTLAEICHEQMKRRPWFDVTNPVCQRIEENNSGSENATPIRKRRKTDKSDPCTKGGRCHICKCAEPMWKLASCSYCNLSYCYGSLFRAFNIQPQDTMEMYHWMCPRCQKICSCAACRRDPTMNPYEPTCTLLGHDTRKVADLRSVESLVDFRQSNLRWLKKAGDDEEGRLKKHQKEADEKRNKALVDNCIELEFPQAVSEGPESVKLASPAAGYFNDYSEIPVDPALEKLDGSSLRRKPSVSDMCRFAGEGQKALQT
ncbi:JmjC domain protein [Aspergillus nomiae NRRL 13137]|uniref:JmjC domain protein n=1 Tax=Aspergillus nomiae NRRL (strain ATCC 15546 / NRRL 13137 / CBS 260.88 / M93) TaxID=1509407 RepID=A0A0L1ILT2_ASPN3|nr:JmjC domain protein [Aspergillus nomiae NRRL 13137]KNG80452.1 JmjC domain protein [Aspergillus nomiae NRRL 13137]